MDYITATLDAKAGEQRSVAHLCNDLKDEDRLFIFECDNSDSTLRDVPDWDNVYKITLNEFPYKTILQFIEHYHVDGRLTAQSQKYNLCMLNRRPTAMRVLVMRHAEYWPNFVGSMYAHEREDWVRPDFKTCAFRDGLVMFDEKFYHHNEDMSVHFNIPEVRLTETATELTRAKTGDKYHQPFPDSVMPPDEWFQSACDLFHEGDQELSDKLAKNFYYKKPFLSLGCEQRFAMRTHGFEEYFEGGSYYDHVMPLAQEVCRDGVPDFAEKIEHNYNKVMELWHKYGEFTQFILNMELHNSTMIDQGRKMDAYLELLEDVPKERSTHVS